MVSDALKSMFPSTATISYPMPQHIPKQTPTSALSAIEDTLDLSAPSRNLPENFQALDESGKNAYLKNLARLLKAGIVGTETLEVRGKPYQSFASTRFLDPNVVHAKTRP